MRLGYSLADRASALPSLEPAGWWQALCDYAGQVGAILWKDLVTEWRSRDRAVAMGLFAMLVVAVFEFALPEGAGERSRSHMRGPASPRSWPATWERATPSIRPSDAAPAPRTWVRKNGKSG